MEKIKVNNSVYEYFSLSCYEGFEAVLKTNDLNEVKENFSHVEAIVVLNNLGQVSNTITDCSKLISVTEICDYYLDDNNKLQSAVCVKLGSIDLAEKVTKLEKQVNPVIDEASMSLDEYKTYRIGQSKLALQTYIAEHPIVATIHNGKEGTYSITEEKQTLMTQQYLSYNIAKTIDPEHAVLTWNETGEVCETWTEEEFTKLLLLVRSTVYPLVSYQQSLEKQIMACNDKTEVAAIEIDYSSVSNEKVVD